MVKVSKKIMIWSIILGITGSVLTGHGLYISLKANLAQYLLQQAWVESKQKGHGIAPWPWADTRPVARLNFTDQEQSYIVLEGSSGRSLAFAPGHLSGSALPGRPGHTIISAHRDTHFNILQTLQISHIFTLETLDNKKFYYQIDGIRVVDTRSEPLLLEPEKGMLTLITCYPFNAINGGSPFRYRVDAIPVPPPV